MYCTQCGAKLPDDAKFCVSCGAQINNTNAGADGADKRESQREVDAPQESTYKGDAVFSEDTEDLYARFMSREYTPKDVDEFDSLNKKFVDYWENKFSITKDQEDGNNLIKALATAIKFQGDSNLFEQTRELCEKLLSTTKSLYVQFGGTENMKRYAWSYWVAGDNVVYGATLEERKEWYLKSIEIYEDVQRRDQAVDERESIALIYTRLGLISDPDEGKNWYLKGIELLEEMKYGDGSLEERKLLISAYRELSSLCLLNDALDEAAIWNEKWMRLAEKVSHDSKSIEDREELSLAYANLGAIFFKQGHRSEAKTMYDKAVENGEMLLRETNTVDAAHNLALLYVDYATIDESHYDQGMLKKAKKILSRLTKTYPQTAEYAEELQSVNAKLKKRAR